MKSWLAVSGLITAPGAFILLFATAVVGLIVLFNTSVEQVIKVIFDIFNKFGFGGAGKRLNLKKPGLKGEFKVSGNIDLTGKQSFPNAKSAPVVQSTSLPLEDKLVTNVAGEEKVWRYPPLGILSDASGGKADRGDIKNNAATIEQRLEAFGISAKVVEVNAGPAVTQYGIDVALGTKLSKITALEKDIALALAAPTGTIRIEAPIPGRSLVGIELPNHTPEFVTFRKMIDSNEMKAIKSKLAVSLGLDVSGKSIVADLARMPHVLIAGQTGSGKSVCINTFLSTLLFRASPAELKLILVDPKRVELTQYNNIPHLLSPVIVDPKKVISALKWLMQEMDRRYKIFQEIGVKNIEGYNEASGFQALPYIILFIDELADIMLFSPVEVEDAVTRIAQMSRATGIHMVLSTQRPSVDVITGLIKANIPCRIAFAVASQIDSRVILDSPGAEKLLGRGDMLYLPPDQAKPRRIQGAFISESDTASLVSFLKNQGISPQYTEEVLTQTGKGNSPQVIPGVEGDVDELVPEAIKIICQFNRASASLLQRRLSVGYARAAKIIDQLEALGVVGHGEGAKPRDVLIKTPEEFFQSVAGNQQSQSQLE